MNRVYIILVNWNGWSDTVECLDSLLALEYPSFRIVISDNGSSDNSIQKIKSWAYRKDISCTEYQRIEAETGGSVHIDCQLTLIHNNGNLGFAGGNNVGIRYATARGDADYYWLLNNDTVVAYDSLSYLVGRVQQQPTVGICGSTVRLYHDRQRIQALGGGHYCRWIGLPWHYGRFFQRGGKINQQRAEMWMNYVEGASMLVTRRFIEEVGLLNEEYFLYFEEADWALRAESRFSLGYASQSVVYHKVGGSIGTNSNPARMSYTSDYFNIRNRLLFTRRFYPFALPTVWLVIVGSLLVRICLGKWDRVMMILRILSGNNDHVNVYKPECVAKS